MVSPHSTEQAFLAALASDPDDVAALDGLGMLAARTGRLDAALSALSRAAALAPHDAQIQIHLAHIFHDRNEWEAAQLQYARALYLAPNDALAHEGAAYTAMRLNDAEAAEKHRSRAFRNRVLTYSSVDVDAPTVLLIVSSHGGNVDTRPYLAAEPINVIKVIAEDLHLVSTIPEFDYVFNGVGDCDRHDGSLVSLRALAHFLKTTTKPVLNHPDKVILTSRTENAHRFAGIAGVRTPRMISVFRSGSSDAQAFLISRCIGFPMLVRTPGYHTGQHFFRANSQRELRAAIEQLPGDELIVMEFLDTSDESKIFRKYRMMTIAGKLYPAHLAISDQWKVHYMNSLTTSSPAFRREEQRFLEGPEAVIGAGATRALERIAAMMDLDYAGIDFALDKRGELVCFEANATMVVALPNSNSEHNARRAAAQAIHHATKRLLWL